MGGLSMFKECNTLAELNAARIKAVSSGIDIMEVNNAYNARRFEILNQRKSFTMIQFKPVPNPEPVQYKTLPIAGLSPELGVLMYKEEGFYV